MIGVPKGLPDKCPRTGVEAPFEKSFQAGRAAKTFQLAFCLQAIDTATGADAAVALQDFFANITGIAAEPPFFYTPRRAKCPAALGNFQIAPTAEVAAMGPLGKCLPIRPPPGHGSFSTHVWVLSCLRCNDFSLQKAARTEHDTAGTHLKLSEGVKRGCYARLRPWLRFAILRKCTAS